MPRPTNKDELVAAATDQYDRLWKMIDSMSDEEKNSEFKFEDRDKNLRDVLIHLHEWHNMMDTWYRVGVLEGRIPYVPGEGYTWKTLPALNLKIWERYQDVSLSEAKDLLKESHSRIMELIDRHTNEELFSKGIYKWTKSSTLGAYFIGSTSSHYDWAMKKIKKHIKTCKEVI